MRVKSDTKPTLGILTVATNEYLSYWKSMARTAENFLSPNIDVTLHVFTDDPLMALQIQKETPRLIIKTHQIPAYGWPEATLLRYKIFNQFTSDFTEDVIMHLDADMLFRAFPPAHIFPNGSGLGIFLVAHPGFWRPRGLGRMKFYLNHPIRLYRDFRMYFSIGALGSWETTKSSTAFVQRDRRHNYICGGTWFGGRSAMLKLIFELEKNVEIDNGNSILAKWHDESHLNWWASEHDFTLLTPSFCYDPEYPQLASLPEYIRAVDKNFQLAL
jgi:hypothetical protein